MNCHLSDHCQSIAASFSMERTSPLTPDRSRKHKTRKEGAKKVDYAKPADFCQLFNDHLDDLYTLSLLLTADHEKAHQCFVSGLDDCLHGNLVFREWAQSWAKRTVIKNSIRLIAPSRNEMEPAATPAEPPSQPLAAITSLPPFDRFVYVLSILENYSDNECSILLDCTVEKALDARKRALVHVSSHSGPADSAMARGAD